MQGYGLYESYTKQVVSAHKRGLISVEEALSKLLNMVMSSATSGELDACIQACSLIVEHDSVSEAGSVVPKGDGVPAGLSP
jgi:hypothetical protein